MKAAFERARAALDFLERHGLDPSPAHYAFARRYLAEPAAPLAREVDTHIDGGLRLTAEAAAAIIARHLRDPDDDPAMARRERAVARQAEELGTLTSGAHDLTHALERDVGSIVGEARGDADGWPASAGGFVARLSDAERELADLRGEIARLRDDVRGGIPAGTGHAPEQDGAEQDGDARQPHGWWAPGQAAPRPQGPAVMEQDAARALIDRLTGHGRSYVLLMFAIDDLPGINRRFGHLVGDNVLNAFAATLGVVFEDQPLVRWSGNELVLVREDIALSTARRLAEEALAAMRDRRLRRRGTGEWIGRITASAGIVADADEPVDHVLERARARLREAADAGGDRSAG